MSELVAKRTWAAPAAWRAMVKNAQRSGRRNYNKYQMNEKE